MTTNARTAILLGLTTTVLVTGNVFATQDDPCVDCHKKETPGIYNEWGMSRHYLAGVGCQDCHGISEGTEGVPIRSGAHEHPPVSPVVSPRVCQPCHPTEYDQFSRSIHAKAYRCVHVKDGQDNNCKTKEHEYLSCAQLYIKYIEGNVDGPGAWAAGTNGCWQCHGSKVEFKDGKPNPTTWPNAGVGRINPDDSQGNCAACHQRHDFTLAEVRRPEVCGVCHNAGGGEPQIEIYHASRHGVSFYQNVDKMNLDNPKWVVGEDYSAAPTCATCHFSATPELPVTHFVDERVLNLVDRHDDAFERYEEHFVLLQIARDVTCRCGPVICNDQCKINSDVPGAKEIRPLCKINGRPLTDQSMTKVCKTCHSESLVSNYLEQYLAEVELVTAKWIDPGRELFEKAMALLRKKQGSQYAQGTDPVTGAWTDICNHDARYAMEGAAMMSPGYAQDNNGKIASDWYSYVTALAELIDENIGSGDAVVKRLAEQLKVEFCTVLSKPTYGGAWEAGKHGPDLNFGDNYLKKTSCKDLQGGR